MLSNLFNDDFHDIFRGLLFLDCYSEREIIENKVTTRNVILLLLRKWLIIQPNALRLGKVREKTETTNMLYIKILLLDVSQ